MLVYLVLMLPFAPDRKGSEEATRGAEDRSVRAESLCSWQTQGVPFRVINKMTSFLRFWSRDAPMFITRLSL